MLGAWYYVILIDSTFNTNKYRKPVIQLIGVTPVQKNFTIGFVLVENEKAETYIWLLNQLRSLLGERKPTAWMTMLLEPLQVSWTNIPTSRRPLEHKV